MERIKQYGLAYLKGLGWVLLYAVTLLLAIIIGSIVYVIATGDNPEAIGLGIIITLVLGLFMMKGS